MAPIRLFLCRRHPLSTSVQSRKLPFIKNIERFFSLATIASSDPWMPKLSGDFAESQHSHQDPHLQSPGPARGRESVIVASL
jgi:hypothetical protein